jgi:hypothetical protein
MEVPMQAAGSQKIDADDHQNALGKHHTPEKFTIRFTQVYLLEVRDVIAHYSVG